MKIKFIGAIKSVTGSCTLLSFKINGREKYSIVDCGMYQGGSEVDKKNFEAFPFDPASLDYVFLTHVHIDHSGLVPKLVKNGFKGQIIATSATADLCGIMLRDSARIQQTETERYNRNRLRLGNAPKEPLYTEDDAKAALGYFKTVKYREELFVYPDISVSYYDAGHVLGSSFLKFKITEDGKQFTVVFSGDIGNAPVPILQDPEQIGEADYLIMESTYGDRVRENDANRSLALARVVNETVAAGGKVIIPSFAVGRTQELIYEMHQLRAKNLVPDIPIFVDSPLACSATEIFRKHLECFDKEMIDYLNSSDDPFNFPNLSYSSAPEESRAINAVDTPQVIISSSGMANNGRILHHLKYNIFKKETTILFVGYQAAGTLGRLISEGVKIVNIMGDKYSVNARIEALHSYSAHADQSGLIKWALSASGKLRNVFLVHGEENSKKILQSKLSEVGLSSVVPDILDEFEITAPESFKQTADGKAQKPVSEETGAAVFAPRYDFMEKPLKKIEGVKAPPDRLDQDLDRMSKKELIKTLKEFRAQVQSMESRIDNLIARVRK